jgi:hypothetical protein
MVVRLFAVACLAFGCLLLGGSGIATAGGPSNDPYAGGQPDGSYSTPDSTDHPDAANDDAAPPNEDEAPPAPDDNGGDDGAAPPQADEPE